MIIDFSGSSVDGSKATSGELSCFYLPRHWRDLPTVITDLFALGSTLYEIFQGSRPHEETPNDQAKRPFREREFPDISAIPCRQIIKECWFSQVDSVENVQSSIQDVIRKQTWR